MKLFDANAWTGSWPFSLGASHDVRSLAAELKRYAIDDALVSPLGAVFAPEPGPANRVLLHESRGLSGIVPVPVINPTLANWRDELAACAADDRVRAVRVLPSYHGFRLKSRAVVALMDQLETLQLRLIVQARLIDERHEFHALKIKAVPLVELAVLLRRCASRPVLVCGLLRSEIFELAPAHPNLICDLSFAEWLDTVPELRKKATVEQLVFGSNTPLLMPGAQVEKVQTARSAERTAVARGNLQRFLRG
ncbi:MAG: hypothetical protein C0518_07110 [Opitutus sp.]|nr:hypothetical protein [Opitutus sp.]